MGLETATIIGIAGLAISGAAAGYGIVSSEQQKAAQRKAQQKTIDSYENAKRQAEVQIAALAQTQAEQKFAELQTGATVAENTSAQTGDLLTYGGIGIAAVITILLLWKIFKKI